MKLFFFAGWLYTLRKKDECLEGIGSPLYWVPLGCTCLFICVFSRPICRKLQVFFKTVTHLSQFSKYLCYESRKAEKSESFQSLGEHLVQPSTIYKWLSRYIPAMHFRHNGILIYRWVNWSLARLCQMPEVDQLGHKFSHLPLEYDILKQE